MIESQISKLESEFGIKLPAEYRSVLLQYPLCEFSEELVPDYEALRESNIGCRKGDPWEFPWSNNLWWIGADGAGGFCFIDCEDDSSTIYYFDHEVPAKSFEDKEALSPEPLSKYIKRLKQAEIEFESESLFWKRSKTESGGNSGFQGIHRHGRKANKADEPDRMMSPLPLRGFKSGLRPVIRETLYGWEFKETFMFQSIRLLHRIRTRYSQQIRYLRDGIFARQDYVPTANDALMFKSPEIIRVQRQVQDSIWAWHKVEVLHSSDFAWHETLQRSVRSGYHRRQPLLGLRFKTWLTANEEYKKFVVYRGTNKHSRKKFEIVFNHESLLVDNR